MEALKIEAFVIDEEYNNHTTRDKSIPSHYGDEDQGYEDLEIKNESVEENFEILDKKGKMKENAENSRDVEIYATTFEEIYIKRELNEEPIAPSGDPLQVNLGQKESEWTPETVSSSSQPTSCSDHVSAWTDFEQNFSTDPNTSLCDNCSQHHSGFCPLLPLLFILMDEDSIDDQESAVVWPSVVSPSKVRERGSVWTNSDLPQGFLFGPLPFHAFDLQRETDTPSKTAVSKVSPRGSFRSTEQRPHETQEWLQFVRRCDVTGQANVAACEQRGEVFCRTLTEIRRGTELVLWIRNTGNLTEHQNTRSLPHSQGSDDVTDCEKSESSDRITNNVSSCVWGYPTPVCENYNEKVKTMCTYSVKVKWNPQSATFACPIEDKGIISVRTKDSDTQSNLRFYFGYNVNHFSGIYLPLSVLKQESGQIFGEGWSKVGRFYCFYCEEKFEESDLLQSHLLEHCRNVFTCSHCKMTFGSLKSLRSHSHIHYGKKPLKCSYCDKRFRVEKNLKCHLKIHSGGKTFDCASCSKKFTRISHLQIHLRIHSGEKPFNCTYCSKKFTTTSQLRSHLLIHRGENPYKCPHCSKQFSNISNLNSHARVHSRTRPYECAQCLKRFTRSGDLKSHQKTHSKEKRFKCACCDKSFRRPNELKIHFRVHSGEKPYTCAHCDKQFIHSSNLVSHLRVHNDEKPYECTHCGRSFSKSKYMKEHLKTHSGKKPFECTYCKRKFARVYDLNTHLRIHTGEKPYDCSYCDKSFMRLCDKVTHLRIIHKEEDDYQCTNCNKVFKKKSTLEKHERVHSSDSPYKCKICQKTLSRATTLKSHLRIHSGEKPFECTYCDEKFKDLNSMKVHVRKHTGEKPYQCPCCEETFYDSSTMRKHSLSHTVNKR